MAQGSNFFGAFNQALPQGAQLGMQGQQLRAQEARQKRLEDMQDWKTLGDLMGLAPGPAKEAMVKSVQKNFEMKGKPLPDEIWGAIKKGDEEFATQMQEMHTNLQASGVNLSPQTLGMLLTKNPGVVVDFMKQATEKKKIDTEQAQTEMLRSELGGGSPGAMTASSLQPEAPGASEGPAMPTGASGPSTGQSALPMAPQMPRPAPQTAPQAAGLARIPQLQAEIAQEQERIAGASRKYSSPEQNRILDNARQTLGAKQRQLEFLVNERDRQTRIGMEKQRLDLQRRESILSPEGFSRRVAVSAAQGQAAAKIQIEKEQTKPLAEDAQKFVHKDSLQHPPTKMTRSEIANSEDYVPVGMGEQKDIREKVASLKMFQTAMESISTVAKETPELFPPGEDENWWSGLKDLSEAKVKGMVGSLTPKHREAIAKLKAVETARARFARAWGDVGNLTEQEQSVQIRGLGLRPEFRDSVLTRLEAMEQMLIGPANEHFESLGLRVRVPLKLQRGAGSTTGSPLSEMSDEDLMKELNKEVK